MDKNGSMIEIKTPERPSTAFLANFSTKSFKEFNDERKSIPKTRKQKSNFKGSYKNSAINIRGANFFSDIKRPNTAAISPHIMENIILPTYFHGGQSQDTIPEQDNAVELIDNGSYEGNNIKQDGISTLDNKFTIQK